VDAVIVLVVVVVAVVVANVTAVRLVDSVVVGVSVCCAV
jgi:hypothetical protein